MVAGIHGNFGHTKGSQDRVPVKSKNDVIYSYDKMEGYLLDLNHKKGGSKAKFLKEVLGYKKGDGKILHKNLVETILNQEPAEIKDTSYGLSYVFKVKLIGKNNKKITANVVVVCQKDTGKDKLRIITLYPDEK